jgi:hypothetical protein
LLYGVHPRLDFDDDLAPPASLLTPLNEFERMEADGEFYARTFEAFGQDRAASYTRSKVQMEIMKKRGDFPEWSSQSYFTVGDMVKLKHHSRTALEFKWKCPYHVTVLGHEGTYFLMTPSGLRLDAPCNQNDIAPWLAITEDNQDFNYFISYPTPIAFPMHHIF